MPSSEGEFRTDDLALATVLDLAGYRYELRPLTNSKAIWIFRPSVEKEEDFDDLLGAYEEWTAQVEPRQFILRFAEMRTELFKLLPKSRRRSISPAPAQ